MPPCRRAVMVMFGPSVEPSVGVPFVRGRGLWGFRRLWAGVDPLPVSLVVRDIDSLAPSFDIGFPEVSAPSC